VDNDAFVKYFEKTITPLVLGRASSVQILSLPTIAVEATVPSGAVVNYSAPFGLNNTDSQSSISCNPTSGSLFPIGNTTVKCTAKDDTKGTIDIATFIVQVEEQSNPLLFFNPSS